MSDYYDRQQLSDALQLTEDLREQLREVTAQRDEAERLASGTTKSESGESERERARRSKPLGTEECAWCTRERGDLLPQATGVCERHRRRFITEAFAARDGQRQGKRWEQVAYSATVVLILAAFTVLGFMCGSIAAALYRALHR